MLSFHIFPVSKILIFPDLLAILFYSGINSTVGAHIRALSPSFLFPSCYAKFLSKNLEVFG